MTVYAVQVPHHFDQGAQAWRPKVNVHAASHLGEVVTLIPHEQVHAALVTQPTLATLRRGLKDFCDEDYLLPVGDITLVAMATAVALNVNRGRARLLRWSREHKKYDIVELHLYGDKS
jgi:hypothetical protein